MAKEAYQGLAMGAKMEGIMESLAQKAHFITARRGKKSAKKRIQESFLLCEVPPLIAELLLQRGNIKSATATSHSFDTTNQCDPEKKGYKRKKQQDT